MTSKPVFRCPGVLPACVAAGCRLAVLGVVLLAPAVAVAEQTAKAVAKAAEDPEARSKSRSLFDGKRLGKWEVVTAFDFKKHGKVEVKDGKLLLASGRPATGVKWTGQFPRMNYELSLDAMRTGGGDFFCGMTFPVGESPLTLIIGGWGGGTTGLSSIDGEPAVENETAGYRRFKLNHWYHIRLRVTPERVEAWIDDKEDKKKEGSREDKKIVDFPYGGRKLSIYWEMEPCLPFGICTWNTSAALRNMRVSPVVPPPAAKR